MLCTTAANKRIIAIPVVNQVVIGEITASRKGIRSNSPTKVPSGLCNCILKTVSPGNYTITAAKYELPVTVINDFDQLVSVDLDITTTNSRVVVTKVPRITLQPRSQLQIKVPIEVIASGDTALRLQLRTPKGSAVGEPARIPLRLAVISPVTTWFTTGMAIILLLAAVIQSVRRVKRRKNHE